MQGTLLNLIGEIFKEKYKSLGWKKQGPNYRQITKDGLGRIINFQSSPWNSNENCSFYINYGLYVELSEEPENDSFKEYECQLKRRAVYNKGVYTITKDTDFSEIKNIVCTALCEADALFDSLPTKTAFIEYILDKGKDIPGVLNLSTCILLYKLGYGIEIYKNIKDERGSFKKLAELIEQENGIERVADPIVSITDAHLMELIEKMGKKERVHSSAESDSFKAYREAETINDPTVFPKLLEIAMKEGKANKSMRSEVYSFIAIVLENVFNEEACQFLVNQVEKEKDKSVRARLLYLISCLSVSDNIDISPLVICSKSDNSRVRCDALRALGAFSSEEAKDALAYYLVQDYEKKYKYEILYAVASLGRIGTSSDVPLLEKWLSSKNSDIKSAASYAINRIEYGVRYKGFNL